MSSTFRISVNVGRLSLLNKDEVRTFFDSLSPNLLANNCRLAVNE